MPHLVAVGISHKTAPVEQREKLALTDTNARTLARRRARAARTHADGARSPSRRRRWCSNSEIGSSESESDLFLE